MRFAFTILLVALAGCTMPPQDVPDGQPPGEDPVEGPPYWPQDADLPLLEPTPRHTPLVFEYHGEAGNWFVETTNWTKVLEPGDGLSMELHVVGYGDPAASFGPFDGEGWVFRLHGAWDSADLAVGPDWHRRVVLHGENDAVLRHDQSFAATELPPGEDGDTLQLRLSARQTHDDGSFVAREWFIDYVWSDGAYRVQGVPQKLFVCPSTHDKCPWSNKPPEESPPPPFDW